MANRALIPALVILLTINSSAQDLLQYVNPNIGTAHSRWFFFTPAAVPYGMAKLAPSTNGHYGNLSGWEAVGYDVRHESIEGFVNFHEWQVGGVSLMPSNGELKVKPGELKKPGSGYRSHFNHKNEIAQAGYYKVLLDDYNISAELTATKHVGFHRYRFPASDKSRIILDIGNKQGESGEVLDAELHMTDDRHFEGYVKTEPRYVQLYDPGGSISMYFWGELNKKPAAVLSFDSAGINNDRNYAKGKGAGLVLQFITSSQEAIECKLGLSYTSVNNARANFMAEAKGLSFEAAKTLAQKTWQRELSKILVTDPNRNNKVKFYTGMFHALLGRGDASDVNGAYPRFDGGIGKLPSSPEGKQAFHFMNTDAIWGAFWNLTQLWALAYPEKYLDYVQTQLEIYKQKGWFGDGISNSNYTSGVGTNFVGLAIAAAYQAGIRGFDTALAYTAIKGNELGWLNRKFGSGKMDVKIFTELGYVPNLENDRTDSTGSQFSASHTMEYSFSAFAAAQMAKAMGKNDDYNQLIRYAGSWKNLFNPTEKLIHPKNTSGAFIDKFDPYQPWRGFQEGNAVQYTFYVPHDPKSLIAAIGQMEFNNRLDSIFIGSEKNSFGGGKEIDAFAGIKAAYNHGNQPNLHASWLFNYSGKPWLTQKWTRAICDGFYGTESIHGYGYGQDEDQGQLGSWYVMAAIGLFDVKGLTDLRPTIQFGSPLFQKVRIKIGNAKLLTIETKNNSMGNVYIQSASFNGKILNDCWIYRDEIMKGGTLVFTMGSQPNQQWAVQNPPPSVQ